MPDLILASSSERRKQILKKHNIKFTSVPANIDEEKYEKLEPIQMVETLSKLKAQKIAKKHKASIILAADTTVVINGEILSKPKDINHAAEMLKKLSGSTHQVITGFTILNSTTDKSLTSHEISIVTFKTLKDEEIEKYINSEIVTDKAGGYAVQEGAGEFVENIDGDYNNIVGLPEIVFKYLDGFGIN